MWRKFEYVRPETVNEACKIHFEESSSAFLAGGTDLLIQMKRVSKVPKLLIDIKNIKELKQIAIENGRLKIGSLVTLREIEKSDIITQKFNLLSTAASNMGSVQIRNRGTVGGNICNASPGADMLPPLIALGAQVKITGLDGSKTLPLEDFFKGPGETVLNRGQILTEIIIPESRGKGAFLKYTVTSVQVAIMNIAVWADITEDGFCKDIRIAMGAAGPKPLRMKTTEELLKDRRITEELVRKAADVISNEIQPSTRERARVSPEYRRHLSKVLLIQAINSVIGGNR